MSPNFLRTEVEEVEAEHLLQINPLLLDLSPSPSSFSVSRSHPRAYVASSSTKNCLSFFYCFSR
ncbi:hypothetical protein CsSME_00029886 [Camellia sinensis var. sinensis]